MKKYDLALALKEAGFPQPKHRMDISNGCCHYGNKKWIEKPNYCGCFVMQPTLSELIEACGSEYLILQKKNTQLWYASAKEHEWLNGSTPEIAVANLYLQINSKK